MTAPSLIALTGATGFIGGALLSCLAGAGWRVRALYRSRRGRIPRASPGTEWVQGELDDGRALDRLLAGTGALIHCAGAVRGATQADFDRINADAVARLAEAAASRSPPPRFLLMSSLAARMPQLSHYAASKWRGECALKAAPGHLRWTILRPPAVYGPGDRELAPLFRCIARGLAPVPAHAAGRFSLIHVDDLASAVLRWLEADAGYGRTFEIDDARAGGYDWPTVLAIAGPALGRKRPVLQVSIPVPVLRLLAQVNLASARLFGYSPMLTPGKVREITHPDWLCDSHDFAAATGWRPLIGLESGLARTYGPPGGT
jgi:nucleoside-diphosphate-sugar epimerase